MSIQPYINYFYKNLNLKDFFRIKINKLDYEEFKVVKNEKKDFLINKNLNIFKIDIKNNEPLFIICKFHFRTKKIFFLNLPILTSTILWTSNCFFLEKNISKIGLELFIRWRIITTIYYKKYPSNNHKYNKYMIRSNKEIDYIHPLGSELSIGL